jgi:ABC-type antimicrobial peptide transport system permease subunit
MKEKDRIWHLMARKLSGEATEEEKKELEEWQQLHPEMTYGLHLLSDLWRTQPEKKDTEGEDAFSRHLTRMTLKEVTQPGASQPASSGYAPTPGAPQNTPAPPEPRRTLRAQLIHHIDLLDNYFKIAWRSLHRNKGFSAINISGLAIGLASAIVLLLWIRNEVSSDQFHEHRDRVYQVFGRAVYDGQIECYNKTPMVMGPVIKNNYPREVEEVVRTNWVGAFIFSNGDKHLATQGLLTDSGFFRLFSFPLLEGNAATALSNPHTVVITATLAKKLFGKEDPLGKTISVDSTGGFVVTGVLKDLPPNTQFNFEYLIPWSYTKEAHFDIPGWDKNSIATYLLLRPGITETAANISLRRLINAHAPELKSEIFLHPMRKWRLYSNFVNGEATGGAINFVRMLAIIAGFILLIACINYMNLSTARSIRRAREVGIRKVVGAGRGSLIGRFLGESMLIAGLAGVLGLIIVIIALPWFNQLITTHLALPYDEPLFWLSGIGFIVFTGLLAGSYPAFYLSAFRPINILRGHFKTIHALVTPRRILVVFQFTFAITFIICTIVIYREFRYAVNRNSGYDKNNLAFVYMKGDMKKNYELIRRDLLSSATATDITRTSAPITEIWASDDSYEWQGKSKEQQVRLIEYRTDRTFVKTMGLHLIAGRDIDIEKYPTDSSAILLTEMAVRQMGLTDPVGQVLRNNTGTWHIVGVIRDFVTGSLFNRVWPVVIQGPNSWFGAITFKLNPQNSTARNIARLAAIIKRYNPNYPFEYFFVDQYDTNKLTDERHFGTLAALFAGMAIFISCLGLFGLSAYMAESRLREVGVRKVLGASIMRLITLLSKDFLVLVIIAFIIASPIAWWCMSHWLEDIPYRIELSWWIFALTGAISVIIAAGTVGFQAVQAALTNPVRVLRTD